MEGSAVQDDVPEKGLEDPAATAVLDSIAQATMEQQAQEEGMLKLQWGDLFPHEQEHYRNAARLMVALQAQMELSPVRKRAGKCK